MKLSEEVKLKIKNEYNSFVNQQYGSTTKEERKKLGANFTPAEITIQMIEKLSSLEGDILDPCCGAGSLLAGCIIAGADPKRVYGNEYEEQFVNIAKNRLARLGVPEDHIHQGDAKDKNCLVKESFTAKYKSPEKYVQLNLWGL